MFKVFLSFLFLIPLSFGQTAQKLGNRSVGQTASFCQELGGGGETCLLLNTSGELRANDGSLANPGISYSSDDDTGLFREGTDKVNIVTGGTASVTLHSDQSVSVKNSGGTDSQDFFVNGTAGISEDSTALISGGLANRNPILRLENDDGGATAGTGASLDFGGAFTSTPHASIITELLQSGAGDGGRFYVATETTGGTLTLGLAMDENQATQMIAHTDGDCDSDVTNGNVCSGTWTVSVNCITGTTCSSPSATGGHFMRVGNVVTIGVRINITTCAATGDMQARFDLPVSTTFTTTSQGTGTATHDGATHPGLIGENSVAVKSNATNNELMLDGHCGSASAAAREFYVSASYQVL